MTADRVRIALLAGCISAVLLIAPAKSLLGSFYYQKAVFVLKAGSDIREDTAESRDVLEKYVSAIDALETAARFDRSNAAYSKAIADVYLRMGKLIELLQTMHEPLERAPSAQECTEKAEAALMRAIALEPTNPDYHFSLAVLYDRRDPAGGRAEEELSKAVKAFPVNASLRYAVARQHLNAGRTGEALEQATILVKTSGSSSGFSRAWLFASFDLIWRITQEAQVFKGMLPDNPDAALVLDDFFEKKWR